MAVAERPLSQRAAQTFAPLNILSMLLLLVGGVELSVILSGPRFGEIVVLVALLLMLPLALVVMVRPRLGVFLLFILSMVVIGIKRLAWNVEIGLAVEALEGVLALGLALSMVTRRDLYRLSSPLTLPVLIYVAYQLIISFHPSLPSVNNMIYSLRDVLNYSVPFFAALYLMRDRRHLRLFLYVWLASAVGLALYGLYQHYFGLNNWERAWLSTSPTHILYGQVRIFSTLGSADAFGMHMAISMVIVLALAFQTTNPKIRYGLLATAPLFVLANLYTLTRGAYLGLAVGVLALALITRKRPLLLVLAISAIGVFGWLQMNQGSLLADRVTTMFSPQQDASFTVRQDYIQTYLPTILASPFGLGPDTSGRQGGALLAQSGIDPQLVDTLAGVPTDNYYFRIALEDGWVGLLIFVGLLLSAFWMAAHIYHSAKDPLVKSVAASLLAIYVAMAVASISNNYFSATELKLFFWFSLGLLVRLPLIEKGSSPATEREGVYQRIGGAHRW